MTVLEYNDVIKGIFWNILCTEAVAQSCSVKKVFFEISQNSSVPFLMKLQA